MKHDRNFSGRPHPWAEDARLAALDRYQILDTPTEADFDDIARLAADVCEAPIAVVNLIADGRQWFKAEVGIGARELPLEVSICAHAMLEADMLVVPDLAVDPRFEANPLVTEAGGLRFYAGALVKTAEGLPLGTVCVLDRQPRSSGVTARQRLTLEMLARQVMTQLELRLALRKAGEAAERQQLLIDELAHRMKNTLAMVQAIVSQTLRTSTSVQNARAEIVERLSVLSRAQDVLTRTSWTAATVADTVDAALAPLALDSDRLAVDGPRVEVGSRATLSLTLAMHELATNAVKYGSLSVAGGRVAITWRLETSGDGETLHFLWQEHGGPPVTPPSSKGFGSRLIESLSRTFSNESALRYPIDGVCWEVTANLKWLQAS